MTAASSEWIVDEQGALLRTEFRDLPLLVRGKVRDVYDLGDSLLFVATDRLSAFDWILPNGIPDKGRVLTRLSAFWFRKLGHLVANHLEREEAAGEPRIPRRYDAILAGRALVVRQATVIPVECVARGYLAGSGWKDYRATGRLCGLPLPPGLRQADRLPEPIFTPATKAESGHDENIDLATVIRRVGAETAAELVRLTLALYREGAAYAESRGLILADTKFEFGLRDGALLLVDEALTPDSSRFWPADRYAPGSSPPSFDKQHVRDWLESVGWDKASPPPALPPEVARGTRERYVEALARLTGQQLDREPAPRGTIRAS